MNKEIKTILFASLIVAMILPFSTMGIAEAAPNENANDKAKKQKISKKNVVDWSKASKSSEQEPISVQSSSGTTYTQCNHGANMGSKCQGYESSGKFWYSTPYSYATVDNCSKWNCADLDFKQVAPSIVSEGGYGYSFKSAQYRSCAPSYGICTSPTVWTSPYNLVVHHNNIPTDTPITHYTIYTYERQGQTISYLVVNSMSVGYEI